MKIFVTGGTGFVGTRLVARLRKEGHEMLILTRSAPQTGKPAEGMRFIQGDPSKPGPWQAEAAGCDAAVNLAGSSIFSRWTKKRKTLILESRIATTRHLVEAMLKSAKPMTLVSASAVGFYGFHGDEELDERSEPGRDFLAEVTKAWEGEAAKASAAGGRVVIARFGIVLGEAGALGQMKRLFKMFIGGPLGSGRQWFPWIHVDDLVEAIVFLVRRQEMSGPVNLCSPNPVRNRELAKALGRALHRPSFVRAPGFMIRLVLGPFGNVILRGQKVLPRKLLDAGFRFRYPAIDEALADVLTKKETGA